MVVRIAPESVSGFIRNDCPDSAGIRNFPGKVVEIENISYMRDQRLALVTIYPVQFNPVKKQLKVLKDVKITLETENPRGELIKNVGPMQNVLSHTILNYEASGGPLGAAAGGNPSMAGGPGQVCWCTGTTWQEAAGSAISCGADYLIIVADELAADAADSSLVDSLADWEGRL